jgi:phosphoribosyl-AMP cyclohydrolase
MSAYLDTLRWSKDGLVPVIVQVRNVPVPSSLACSSECSTAHAAIEDLTTTSGWAEQCLGTVPASVVAPAGRYCSNQHTITITSTGVAFLSSNPRPELLVSLSVGICCPQHVDTGELLMQAYADRAALSETLQTK